MKRIICLLMIMLLGCFSGTLAEETTRLEIMNAMIADDGSVQTVLYATSSGELKTENFSISLDQQQTVSSRVEDYKESDLGTTWMFVVDLVPNSNHVEPAKDLMTALVNALGTCDNAAIITADMLINQIGLTAEKEILIAQVGELKANSEKKINNTQIASAFMLADSLKDARPHVNVMILTDGQTVNNQGKTWEELNALAAASNATVYSLSFLPKDVRITPATENANHYSELALQSTSGFAKIFQHGTYSNINTILLDILEHESNFYVATIPAQNFEWSEILINLNADEKVVAAKLQLSSEQKEKLKPAMTPEPIATSTPAPTSIPTPEPDDLGKVLELVKENIVLVATGVVLIVLLIILLVTIKKNKQQITIHNDVVAPDVFNNKQNGGTDIIIEETGIRVCFRTLGPVEARDEASFEKELIIGRDENLCGLAFPRDQKISAKHAKLSYRAGEMYIEDLHSTNGTKLNGMKINSMVPLQQQDVIMMGLSTFEITWKQNG